MVKVKRVRTVFAVVVKTKHMLSDYLQSLRDMVGMNLIAYERMIEDACGEAYQKLITKYPSVRNVRITTAQVRNGAAEIICYGEIEEEVEVNGN